MLALGFGLATLIVAAFVRFDGQRQLVWVVFALGLVTLLLARTARVYQENRWLYLAALCPAAVGLFTVWHGLIT